MEELVKKLEALMATELAADIKLLLAFAVKKTETLTDDEIVENADLIAGEIAKQISDIKELDPSSKDALKAGVNVLKAIAAKTETKWDDFVVGLASKVV